MITLKSLLFGGEAPLPQAERGNSRSHGQPPQLRNPLQPFQAALKEASPAQREVFTREHRNILAIPLERWSRSYNDSEPGGGKPTYTATTAGGVRVVLSIESKRHSDIYWKEAQAQIGSTSINGDKDRSGRNLARILYDDIDAKLNACQPVGHSPTNPFEKFHEALQRASQKQRIAFCQRFQDIDGVGAGLWKRDIDDSEPDGGANFSASIARGIRVVLSVVSDYRHGIELKRKQVQIGEDIINGPDGVGKDLAELLYEHILSKLRRQNRSLGSL